METHRHGPHVPTLVSFSFKYAYMWSVPKIPYISIPVPKGHEGMINDEMLAKGRNLANTAIKLINGYMNYLNRSGKSTSSIKEDSSVYPITDP